MLHAVLFQILAAASGTPAIAVTKDSTGLTLTARESGYVVLLGEDPSGAVRVFFPYSPQEQGIVHAGAPLSIATDPNAPDNGARAPILYAAYSVAPFDFSAYSTGDRWTDSAFANAAAFADPVRGLGALVASMSTGPVRFFVRRETTGQSLVIADAAAPDEDEHRVIEPDTSTCGAKVMRSQLGPSDRVLYWSGWNCMLHVHDSTYADNGSQHARSVTVEKRVRHEGEADAVRDAHPATASGSAWSDGSGGSTTGTAVAAALRAEPPSAGAAPSGGNRETPVSAPTVGPVGPSSGGGRPPR
jgi:hypothetical protein